MTDSVHLSSQQGPGTADGGAASDKTAISAYRALAQWWGSNARDFPWRFGKTTPWGILVSEVMSQQTPMSRVLPYWEKWMGTWPDPQAVSEASTAEIISAWGHLGYPRRALRLQECARTLVRDCGGRLPASYDGLTALPGIGDYTASAVLSFAFGIRIPVIDTNTGVSWSVYLTVLNLREVLRVRMTGSSPPRYCRPGAVSQLRGTSR